jgi:hypothetical protein
VIACATLETVSQLNFGGDYWLYLDDSYFSSRGGQLRKIKDGQAVNSVNGYVALLAKLDEDTIYAGGMPHAGMRLFDRDLSPLSLPATDVFGSVVKWHDWTYSPILGQIFTGYASWIYSEEQGWWCIFENANDFYAWDTRLGWLWTSASLYPWLYSYEQGWLCYVGSDTDRWFWVASHNWYDNDDEAPAPPTLQNRLINLTGLGTTIDFGHIYPEIRGELVDNRQNTSTSAIFQRTSGNTITLEFTTSFIDAVDLWMEGTFVFTFSSRTSGTFTLDVTAHAGEAQQHEQGSGAFTVSEGGQP